MYSNVKNDIDSYFHVLYVSFLNEASSVPKDQILPVFDIDMSDVRNAFYENLWWCNFNHFFIKIKMCVLVKIVTSVSLHDSHEGPNVLCPVTY